MRKETKLKRDRRDDERNQDRDEEWCPEAAKAKDPVTAEDWRRECRRRDAQRRNRGKRGEWKHPDRPNRRWTPWLLIRYRDIDIGLRPIPSGEAFWLSPDVYVESSDPSGNGVAGEPNWVHARIFNLGAAPAAPTSVEFFWGNPSIGLGGEHMHFIGRAEGLVIPSQRMVAVRCPTPWIPEFVNGGHECLMVNVHNHILDPIIVPFNARLDRHVGQRNITVVELAAGGAFKFMLDVNNLLPLQLQVDLAMIQYRFMVDRKLTQDLAPQALLNAVLQNAQPRPMEVLAGQAAMERRLAGPLLDLARTHEGKALPGIQVMERKSLMIEAQWTEHRAVIYPSKEALKERCLGHGSDSEGCGLTVGAVGVASDRLNPFEQRRLGVRLTAPRDARPGEWFVVHFMQRRQYGIAGGYTVVVKVPEDATEEA